MEAIRVHSVEAKSTRCIPARLLPGTDLLSGIEEVCRKHHIQYGYVSCIGSLQRAGYKYLVPNDKLAMKAGYGDILRKEGPVEFLNGTGFICQNEHQYDIHFHAMLCDAQGVVFGGHMVKDENPALTTIDLVIYEISDADMLRVYDEETMLTQFLPCRV